MHKHFVVMSAKLSTIMIDKQIGKRNEYFRNYNMKHTERYERVGIDLAFEKWKEEYYRECSCFRELPPVTIDEEELYKQFRNI